MTTIEVIGPAGRSVVDKSELAMWLRKGYRVVSEAAKEEPDYVAESEADDSPTAADYEGRTVPELKRMADEAGIEGSDNMRKAELIEALTAAQE